MDITFDLVVLIIFLFFTIRGAVRGAIAELIGLVGLFAGIYLAGEYAPQLVPYLQYPVIAGYETILSYAIIFLGTMISVTIIGYILEHIFDMLFLGFLDHFFGGVIGLIKALLVCLIIKAVVTKFFPDMPFIQNSLVAPYLDQGYDFIYTYLPENIKNILPDGIKSILPEKSTATNPISGI